MKAIPGVTLGAFEGTGLAKSHILYGALDREHETEGRASGQYIRCCFPQLVNLASGPKI